MNNEMIEALPDGSAAKRSVGRVLFVIGLMVSAVIVFLSVFLSFRLSNEEALVEDMREIIQAVSNETVANTESFLAPAERSVEEISGLVEKGRIDVDSELPLDEFFFDILRVNQTYDGIFVGRSDGSFTYVIRNEVDGYTTKEIAISPAGVRTVELIEHDEDDQVLETRFDLADPFDPRTRPWFERATNSVDGEAVWTAPYVFFSSGNPGVTRAQAVTGPDGETAVIGIDIRIDELSTFMAERSASPNGNSFIIDRNLSVVAYRSDASVVNDLELAKASDLDDPPLAFVSARVENLDGEDLAEFVSGSVDGEDYQFAITSLSNNPDWVVAVTAPDDDFLARVRNEQLTSRTIAALGGLISVSLLVAGGFVVNSRYRRERDFAEVAIDTAVARAEERDAAQSRLSKTVEDLARSNADLEEFAYATAHDLRTPLRAIGGYAELILREAEGEETTPEVSGYAEQIFEGYERMCLTMDNLLEHARSGVDEPVVKTVELAPIAHSATGDFDGLISELDAEIVVGDLGSAAVDPVAMSRIFQNLISNALKYHHSERVPRIEITSERQGAAVLVRVRDNGVGVAERNHDAAFRLFSRLSNDQPGSGVGLALVKKLVEEHDGLIDLTSVEGEGSVFTITLPAEPRHDDRVASDAR